MSDQKGFVVWMTGLSGSGKSTIAMAMIPKLKARGVQFERLDGDIVRKSLTRDLGFTKEDRSMNIERVTFVAKLLSRNGIGCICSFISPYQSVRDGVKKDVTNFIEVYVNAPLEVCEDRDVKGMYKLAREGVIKNFTGISDPFEAPENPDFEIRTDQMSVDESAEALIQYLEENGYISAVATA